MKVRVLVEAIKDEKGDWRENDCRRYSTERRSKDVEVQKRWLLGQKIRIVKLVCLVYRLSSSFENREYWRQNPHAKNINMFI